MDDTVLLPSSITQELSGERAGGGIDIISSLSDHVLHHVLSFLSTKDSIRTSILSRRWQYLWTSISNIDLDDISSWRGKRKDLDEEKDYYPMCRRFFLNFVDRVLLLHDASDIKRLGLRFALYANSSRLNSWISAAVRHNVQELELSFPVKTDFVFPCCLFTCESLLSLNLDVECVLKTPSYIHFSSLKTLEFYGITFSDDKSTQHVFSSCPVLQELTLLHCEWENIRATTISIPSLQRLTIENDPPWEEDDTFSCVVKIYAGNLVDLDFKSNLKIDFHLCDLSSLVNASIYLPYEFMSRQDVASRLISVLTGIRYVRFLTISDVTLQSLKFVENYPDRLPTYYNMTHLEVAEEFIGNLSGVLMDLVEKSPNLEVLDFKGFDPEPCFNEVDDLMFERVPSCFKNCLKTFSIDLFYGKPAEMHFLSFLLKNAMVLEKTKIYCKTNLPSRGEKEEEISNRIKMLPRASESCLIEFLLFSWPGWNFGTCG